MSRSFSDLSWGGGGGRQVRAAVSRSDRSRHMTGCFNGCGREGLDLLADGSGHKWWWEQTASDFSRFEGHAQKDRTSCKARLLSPLEREARRSLPCSAGFYDIRRAVSKGSVIGSWPLKVYHILISYFYSPFSSFILSFLKEKTKQTSNTRLQGALYFIVKGHVMHVYTHTVLVCKLLLHNLLHNLGHFIMNAFKGSVSNWSKSVTVLRFIIYASGLASDISIVLQLSP